MYTVASPGLDPYLRGDQLPNPNECNTGLASATREAILAPNSNECNSTLTSATGSIYIYIYIYIPPEHSSTDPQMKNCAVSSLNCSF